MIRNTFLMLDGIGEKTERRLWREGILSWDDFISEADLPAFLNGKTALYREMLIYFSHELENNNSAPFAEFIKKSDHWRLYDHFRNGILCIDIETNGLPPNRGGEITVVGIYDGSECRQYVHGINLEEDLLVAEFSSCKLLVSFYGTVFDMPLLCRKFPSLSSFRIPHFDLCFGGRRLGISGGLKSMESRFGIARQAGIHGLTGRDAVRLWQMWRDGNHESLDTLLSYNRADTINLQRLAEEIYCGLYRRSGIEKYHEKFHSK